MANLQWPVTVVASDHPARRGADRAQRADAQRADTGRAAVLAGRQRQFGHAEPRHLEHGSDGRDMTFMVDGMVLNGIEGKPGPLRIPFTRR